MLYTTFKANKANGIDDSDIAIYCEEAITAIGAFFGNDYIDDDFQTQWDKLESDFTMRQIASGVLKGLRAMAKDKEEPIMIWNKTFLELDCDGAIAYDQIEALIKNGTITGTKQLREIESKAKKQGYTIRKDIMYDTENHYWAYHYISDLIDEYFPCYADTHDYCNNCGNCQ